MDSMLKSFFWGGSVVKRTIHWRAGNVLYAPKDEGGLGFRPFHTFNMALLAKQAWRVLLNKDALWVRVLKSIYFPNSDFLNAKKGSKASWIWSSICEAKTWMRQGIIRVIGNGRSSRIFHDPWRFDRAGRLLPFEWNDNETVDSWIEEVSREWKFDILANFLSPNELRQVAAVPIGPASLEDFWAWRFNEKGDFTVKSAYIHFHNNTRHPNGQAEALSDVSKKRWKWLWSLSIPPKLKFFIWNVVRRALASKENLFARKCSQSKACPLCGCASETIFHCLFVCPHAAEGWNQEWPNMPRPTPLSSILEWLESISQVYPICSVQKIVFLMWKTWKARNEKIFRGTPLWPPSTISKAAADHLQWFTCPRPHHNGSLPTQPIPPPDHSTPPPGTPVFEVHCDSSFFDEPQKAAYGVIVSNSHGQVCDGKAELVHRFSPIEAEAMALLEASRMAASLSPPCLVKTDCLQLVQAMERPPRTWPWRAAARIGMIKLVLDSNPQIIVRHFCRKLNSKADWVARSCAKNQLPPQWLQIIDLVAPLL
ncbi:unnamed protein product [Linum trigynum]|uniref:Reverse transcriptase zinc-binding domain-containing protein n=1 Tax=Linum trigynum TaxID=586398 RepID=A0AAV2CAF1_9ROSI